MGEKQAITQDVTVRVENTAEQLRETAIKLKGERNYQRSAQSFMHAAREYGRLSDVSNRMESGKAYEEAAAMFKLAGQEWNRIDAMKCAAKAFDGIANMETRTAKLYEKLAEACEVSDGAASVGYLTKAKELYDFIGDGRAVFTEIAIIELHARLQMFKEAFAEYSNIIQKVEGHTALRFSLGKYALNACICALGIPDIAAFDRFTNVCESHPLISSAPEFRTIMDMQKAVKAEDGEGLLQILKRLPGTALEKWHEKAFKTAVGEI
ncbi:hypothetical protein HDU96_006202 [Phlyctochytrium bullatum]|nr:hypothetical protein HDU96_006202 [Phlyctochytrium bullatum]